MTYPIIGLMGRKRHGKDSVANVLVEEFGFKRMAFADALKRAALALDPIIIGGEDCCGWEDVRLSQVVAESGWEGAKEEPEVRRVLQNYGVAIREIDEDFWVRAVMTKAIDHALCAGPIVITDVRFPNEYASVMQNGKTVRVYRPGMPDDDTHISETALDNFAPDRLVTNDGTLDDLETSVRWLVAQGF